MLRSSISLTNIIIESYTSELKSELKLIQVKANKLLERQRLISIDVKNTGREDIEANVLQSQRSNETIKKSNNLIIQVSQIHQNIISWSHILDIVKQQPITNPNEMSIVITDTKVPKGVENKLLHELLELFEKMEEYMFCSLVKEKISDIAA